MTTDIPSGRIAELLEFAAMTRDHPNEVEYSDAVRALAVAVHRLQDLVDAIRWQVPGAPVGESAAYGDAVAFLERFERRQDVTA